MKNSEIIISNNTIYHLGLHPEQLYDTIITVGDPGRVAQVSRYFDKVLFKVQKREFITHGGLLNGKPIMVVSTGIGTDNIDIVLNELHFLANFDFKSREPFDSFRKLRFIRMGTSGALQSRIHLDSLLVSEFAIGLDNLMYFYNYLEPAISKFSKVELNKKLPVKPYYAQVSESMLALFSDWNMGTTLTCPGFYGPQGRMLPYTRWDLGKLVRDTPITNMEMETAGIYGMAALLGHEAISLNAILANRVTDTFSKNPQKTIEHLIETALQRII